MVLIIIMEFSIIYLHGLFQRLTFMNLNLGIIFFLRSCKQLMLLGISTGPMCCMVYKPGAQSFINLTSPSKPLAWKLGTINLRVSCAVVNFWLIIWSKITFDSHSTFNWSEVNFHRPSLLFANSSASTSCILPLILVITLKSIPSPKRFPRVVIFFFLLKLMFVKHNHPFIYTLAAEYDFNFNKQPYTFCQPYTCA